jgi:hypothetical protein
MRPLAGTLSLLVALALPAGAQSPASLPKPDPADVRALAAQYELTNAEATRKCAVTLDARPTGRGFALVFDRNLCIPLFGFLGEVSAWTPGIAGAVLLVAPDARIVAEFTEGVGGVYEAIRENDAVYFLANLQFVDPSERVQVTDLFGDWTLSRPDGSAPCRVRLTDQIVGNEQFALRIDSSCDPSIAQAGILSWQFERGDIVLRPPTGEPLRFGRQEGGVWVKVPDKPRPLVLSRP